MLLRCLDTASRVPLEDENNKNDTHKQKPVSLFHSVLVKRLGLLIREPCFSLGKVVPIFSLLFALPLLSHVQRGIKFTFDTRLP